MARPRKIVVHTEVTLDNRISRADAFFWEPFACGEQETPHVNRLFERADTCVMGRGTYQSGGVQTLIEGLCRLVGESIRVRPPRR